MGWQSYAVSYDCEKEKQRIYNAIKKHNDYDIAEELIFIYDVPDLELVLFGNGGGRDSTYQWMLDYGLNVMWAEEVEHLQKRSLDPSIP